MKLTRKLTSGVVIILLALTFFAVIMPLQDEAHATVAKAAVKKAKTYSKSANKLFKVKGCWYCFSKKKVKKGLQKVGSNYYFFNKSTGKMYLKTGLKKVSTAYYYFKKSSGKAPAYRNTSWKDADNKVWFFKSNGKRYNYSYKDTGSTAGNTAAGAVLSAASIKDDDSTLDAKLLKAYKEIVKNYGYSFITPSAPKTVAELGKLAKSMTDSKEGKCYNYAALTYVAFKALGAAPVYYNGAFKSEDRVHAWVILKGEDDSSYIYDSNQDNVASKGVDFYGKLITYRDDASTSFTIEGMDYIYYPGNYIE